MKQPRALSFAVCIGFMLIAGLWVAPAKLTAASTTSSIVGTWEGTVDPGAQAKKTVVLHISVGQDGIISGTIDYPIRTHPASRSLPLLTSNTPCTWKALPVWFRMTAP